MSDSHLEQAIVNIAKHSGLELNPAQIKSYAAAANDLSYRQALSDAHIVDSHLENVAANNAEPAILKLFEDRANNTFGELARVEAQVKLQHGVDPKFPLDEAAVLADFNRARDPNETAKFLEKQMELAAFAGREAGFSR